MRTGRGCSVFRGQWQMPTCSPLLVPTSRRWQIIDTHVSCPYNSATPCPPASFTKCKQNHGKKTLARKYEYLLSSEYQLFIGAVNYRSCRGACGKVWRFAGVLGTRSFLLTPSLPRCHFLCVCVCVCVCVCSFVCVVYAVI